MAKDVFVFDDHRTNTTGMPEVDIRTIIDISAQYQKINSVCTNKQKRCASSPTNTGAPDLNGDLSRLQTVTIHHLLGGRRRIRDVEVVLRVGVHPDVGLQIEFYACAGHCVCVSVLGGLGSC